MKLCPECEFLWQASNEPTSDVYVSMRDAIIRRRAHWNVNTNRQPQIAAQGGHLSLRTVWLYCALVHGTSLAFITAARKSGL